ncbi:MAG TPA: PKD domain-containing protein [Solirubrobacteraceae bacterium]|nr:PKD domain-containing protein [Solirubrobacteraceae bacterium]
MIEPLSQFALTVDALAQAGGPYDVDAGTPVTFTGAPNKPNTTYSWTFGDGGSAQGRVVTHSYGDDGIYVAVLTTVVNEPGGVTTRQFALVRARNVPAVVDPHPPVTCKEGEDVLYEVTFSDQEWLETHEAWFDWGDDSLPTKAEVSETNDPPRAQGSASARHAYCHSGQFTITVSVRDRHGGVGRGTIAVEALNVAPHVDAGHDLYAYPCSPITLVALFTDPGWCERHTATWDFGDATPRLPATVVERHEPPEGVGYAAATHTYREHGDFFARCVVTDDVGASGEDWLVVRVIDILNPGFEHGFRQREQGQVANHWEPYVLAPEGFATQPTSTVALPGGTDSHAAEQYIVHGGRRSQCLHAGAGLRVGILQCVGANPGWDYQLTAFYSLDQRGGGRCRLGVDPRGSHDPQASSIVWSAGNDRRGWMPLTVRVTARERQLTVFLELGPPPPPTPAENSEPPIDPQELRTPAVAWFDDVELRATPCRLRVELPRPHAPIVATPQPRGGEREPPRNVPPTTNVPGVQTSTIPGVNSPPQNKTGRE